MAQRHEKAKYYTAKYKDYLRPCPVCGSTDIRVVSDRAIFPPKNVWSVVCTTPSCECTQVYIKVKDAVAGWVKLCGEKNKGD